MSVRSTCGLRLWVWLVVGVAGLALPKVPAGPASPRWQPPNLPPTALFECPVEPRILNAVDEAVFPQLRRLGITPARPCTDAVFLRRVYLDVIGTLPNLEEARAFLVDRRPDKRRRLVEQLLDRPEFADYWAMKWCDILRVKSEFPIKLWPNAVQAYHRWIRTAIRDNRPYDQVARELLTASGSNFRVPPVNFWRATPERDPESLAAVVALTFMGERLEHWPAASRRDLAGFFANVGYKSTGEWKEEIVYFDPAATNANLLAGPRTAVLPDGTRVELTPMRDPREVFADWLVRPENPRFTRVVVNRIWAWLLGRGIVHEPDDFRPDNPPANSKLLAVLKEELIRSGFDLKAVYRLILNSQTYAFSPIPRSKDPRAESQFAFYPLRRLDAEVLIDALCAVTGTTEKYESPIPEPYTIIPEGQRAISLADGSLTSSFLELFGRPPRDTGLMSERNNEPSFEQRLHLLNSSHIQRKIERGPVIKQLLSARGTPEQMAARVYLTILSRLPTQAEMRTITDYLKSHGGVRGPGVRDVVWALLNSSEFLYRH